VIELRLAFPNRFSQVWGAVGKGWNSEAINQVLPACLALRETLMLEALMR
jgi:hypothetical protein